MDETVLSMYRLDSIIFEKENFNYTNIVITSESIINTWSYRKKINTPIIDFCTQMIVSIEWINLTIDTFPAWWSYMLLYPISKCVPSLSSGLLQGCNIALYGEKKTECQHNSVTMVNYNIG